MINKKKYEIAAAISLCIISIILIIDAGLIQIFDSREHAKNLTIYYCIGFIFFSIKYKNVLLAKKYVIIPLYIMVFQTIYSLFIK
tara:strand:+ start:695 stop:949 length:255 start_codon:yes stop_codon:yes gene_type:complete